MSVKADWAPVVAWAESEIKRAHARLEKASASEISALQERIAVMRELQRLKDTPVAPVLPPPVNY